MQQARCTPQREERHEGLQLPPRRRSRGRKRREVSLPRERAALLAQLSCHVLSSPVYCKELQIVAGHWCRAVGFRREASCVSTEIWRVVCAWGPGGERQLSDAAGFEFWFAA